MASTTKKTTGFNAITCPLCGAGGDNQNLSIGLAALDQIYCGECDESFTPKQAIDKVTAELAEWEKIAKMLEFGRELAAE